MEQGLLIVIDGPSCSGKDTIIKQVLKDCKKLNIKVASIEETKEEGYDRDRILSSREKGEKKTAKTIIEERGKIYKQKVIPQLLKGRIIIANRGEPSTLVYQTIKNEMCMEEVWNMHRTQNILIPDLVVITNCSVLEAIRRDNLRKSSSGKKKEKFLSGKFTEDRTLIHANYEKVKNFLRKKGVNVIYLNTDTMDIPNASQEIVSFIEKLHN